MPEDVFDIGAATIAEHFSAGRLDIHDGAKRLAAGYAGSYLDHDLAKQWVLLIETMVRLAKENRFEAEQLPVLFRWFQYYRWAIKPDGSKRLRFPIFHGAFFRNLRHPPKNRTVSGAASFTGFILKMNSGNLRQPPRGWKP